MATRRRTQQAPSETYAAREARGRPIVSLSISVAHRDLLTRLSTEDGTTKSDLIERLLDAEAKRRARRK